MILLLILIALGVACGTAFQRLARMRAAHGPDSPEAAPSQVLAVLGVRVSVALLVVAAFVLLAGNGEGMSSDSYAGFVLLALLALAGCGAFWLYRDRQARKSSPGSGKRSCPHCAEPIQATASVCRYCGRDIEPQT